MSSVTRPRIHERSTEFYSQYQLREEFLISCVRIPYYESNLALLTCGEDAALPFGHPVGHHFLISHEA